MNASHTERGSQAASQGALVLVLVSSSCSRLNYGCDLKSHLPISLEKQDEREPATNFARWFLWVEIWRIKKHKGFLQFTSLYYNTTHRGKFYFSLVYTGTTVSPNLLWCYQYT